MPLEQLLALATLAFVGSFTPGPNNMIATVTGANHGFRAALPHVFGVPFGFATMLIAGAVGVAALLLTYPWMASLIKWIGIAYLLFIAWQLARPYRGSNGTRDRTVARPLSFWQSASFQYANPKAWMLVAATTGSFMARGATITSIALIVIVFSIAAMGSIVTWAWVGAALRSWLAVGARMRTFNITMGVLLAATALWLAVQ
jgi:threonine/homoserine/homoserine lactone efflux protein